MTTRKVALVTGSSRGIGAATARRLVKDGYRVCINYRADAGAAGSIAAELGHENVLVVQADVSNEADVVRMFATIDRDLGQLDALVNNAGILRAQAPVHELDADRVNAILRVNVTGSFLCCREAVKRMSSGTGGSGGAIVNVSSVAALTGAANEYVDYAASKSAVDTLTKGLALEVAGSGIRVNGVRPGFIYTDMHADGGEPDRVDRLASSIPMQRGGSAVEVANAIAWLLSNEASYVTGNVLNVAGGR